jgi:hypothetical protein
MVPTQKERETPTSKYIYGLGMNVNIRSCIPAGLDTKNDSAGKAKQEFTEMYRYGQDG